MIQYAFATKFGLENPTYQNVPAWAIVQQYPRVLGAELGRLPDCTPNLNTVSGSPAMYGMGHYSNAFEPMLTQIQQIIQFEMERKKADASLDQAALAAMFNELQVKLSEVMSKNPQAFFAPNGTQYLHPLRGAESAWAELLCVILDHPVMEGVLERYPQLEQFHHQLAQQSGVSLGGVLLILGLTTAAMLGAGYAINRMTRRPPMMPPPQMMPPRLPPPMLPPSSSF